MSKSLLVIGVIGLAIGPVAYDTVAYYDDQKLKSFSTEQCKEFNNIESPQFDYIPRRYKHEDKSKFYELRERCELSIKK